MPRVKLGRHVRYGRSHVEAAILAACKSVGSGARGEASAHSIDAT